MSRDIYNRDKGAYGLVQIGKNKTRQDTYTPIPRKILKKKQESPGVYTFTIEKTGDYGPGQFLQCSVLGAGECPISFSTWNEKYMDLTIKEEGRVSKALCGLNVGDIMHVRGPYGKGYPMQHFTGNDIVITGAGTGVAPLKGVIDYIAAHREQFGRVHLFFGFHSPDAVLFKKEMVTWHKQFDTQLTVSRPPRGYHGLIGHSTDFLEKSMLNNTNKIAIACGPVMMINQSVQIFKNLGFNEDQIFVSHERHMKCATGVCGHCMIKGQYCCKDGPVFRYDDIGNPNE